MPSALAKDFATVDKKLNFKAKPAQYALFVISRIDFLIEFACAGYPMWPACVMDDLHANYNGVEPSPREKTVPVMFFGSYDHARYNPNFDSRDHSSTPPTTVGILDTLLSLKVPMVFKSNTGLYLEKVVITKFCQQTGQSFGVL
jgi:hypothetical protein